MLRKGMVILKGFLSVQEQTELAASTDYTARMALPNVRCYLTPREHGHQITHAPQTQAKQGKAGCLCYSVCDIVTGATWGDQVLLLRVGDAACEREGRTLGNVVFGVCPCPVSFNVLLASSMEKLTQT